MGHSRLGRDNGRSNHFRYAPIATDSCDATKNRDVPGADPATVVADYPGGPSSILQHIELSTLRA
jgi:hypothetical protein